MFTSKTILILWTKVADYLSKFLQNLNTNCPLNESNAPPSTSVDRTQFWWITTYDHQPLTIPPLHTDHTKWALPYSIPLMRAHICFINDIVWPHTSTKFSMSTYTDLCLSTVEPSKPTLYQNKQFIIPLTATYNQREKL